VVDTRRRGVEEMLANVPMFAQGGRQALSRLARSAAVIDAPRGTVLFRRNDPSQGIYFVASGQVKLSIQTPTGSELVVGLIGAGESFGESTMFLGLPHTVSGEVLANSRLVHIPARAVTAEVKRNAEFARRMILALSARLHNMISGLESYTLRSGTQRVVGYLLSHLPPDGVGDHPMLTLPAQKRIIASQLNLTQEHFSRILHELITRGMIEVRGKVVTILEPQALRTEAAGPAPPKAFLDGGQSRSSPLC
jgi:CRP/FNR family transcriptional regulator, dissimilatory nitrate respiration regulator